MSDTERPSTLVTPKGRTMTWLTTTIENGRTTVKWCGHVGFVEDRGDFILSVAGVWHQEHRTMDEALRTLDARADETVAALLPPGSLVVTEERVRELAKVLVARVGPFCGEGDCGVCVTARDEFLSALRAGAKS